MNRVPTVWDENTTIQGVTFQNNFYRPIPTMFQQVMEYLIMGTLTLKALLCGHPEWSHTQHIFQYRIKH